MSSELRNMIGMSRTEMERLAVSYGELPYRGRQIYRWIYSNRVTDFEAMTDLEKDFRAKLAQDMRILLLHRAKDNKAGDGTHKFLYAMTDGEGMAEAVLIPEGERLTACLSTQVGCILGCRFCATGNIGFQRNLSAGEIAGQFLDLEQAAKRKITNVVMMGMGEPLLNRRALFKAVRLIIDRDGIALPARKLTISTVGWVPGIREMIRHDLKVKLAISLNAITEQQRLKLMSLAARFTIPEILSAGEEYARQSGTRLGISYLLLNGENDSEGDALRLAKLLARLPVKVNLMQYNRVESSCKRSPMSTTLRFQNTLRSKGLTVTLRISRGDRISAACGQLAAQYKPGSGRLMPHSINRQ